jgi:hypothetical protein
MDIIVSAMLPIAPGPGADGRRIVRHGLADVLAWLGEDVGPKPGEACHVLEAGGTLFVSQEIYERIVADMDAVPQRVMLGMPPPEGYNPRHLDNRIFVLPEDEPEVNEIIAWPGTVARRDPGIAMRLHRPYYDPPPPVDRSFLHFDGDV